MTPFVAAAALANPGNQKYQNSIAAEMRIYQHCLDVHNLPQIFHYWSNRHILPELKTLGFSSAAEMFEMNLVRQFDGEMAGTRHFVSLGSGNCELEIMLAARLRDRGQSDFQLDCVDLNPAMLERGRRAAVELGLQDCVSFIEGDFNKWRPAHNYHGVMANQSLHHVVLLEELFGEVKKSLQPGGVFIISDIIGRNGHLRWPEALSVVHEFWRRLPPSYRWNRRAARYEELFSDHDCSGEGFEGVRSEDILPLLLERFHFRFFFPFGNVIDPFVDRSFGPNFDAGRDFDREFIDRIHQKDEFEFAAGCLTPAHMMAVVTNEPGENCVFRGNLMPGFCIRHESRHGRTAPSLQGPVYDWGAWPDSTAQELEKACGMLVESANMIERQTGWALSLEKEASQRLAWGEDLERQMDSRTEWALKLDGDVRSRTAWAVNLQREVENRTEWVSRLETWARGLEADVAERTVWALELERELGERTAWAFQLQEELALQTGRAEKLNSEVRSFMRNPFRLLIRIGQGVLKRIRMARSRKMQV